MRTSATETRVIEELRRANAELRQQLDERTAELHEKNERYSLVSEAVAEGVYDWNVEQDTLFVSSRLMEMFGFEGAGLDLQAWFALVHEADRATYRSALRDCFKGVTPKVGCEYRILLQSGEYRWVEDHGLPIRDAAGRAIRLVGAVSDVTERKKDEDARRDTNHLNEALLGDLNAVIDTIDYGVLFMGPDLRARVINRAFREMWGIADAFIAARPTMADLINFNRHTGLYDMPEAEFDAFVERRVAAIQAGDIDPVEMRRSDGRTLRYQGVVLPDGGRLLTYLDITEAKRREAELREALEQQTATAEVLGVINSSPGNLAPVFDAILEKAHRVCGATQGTLQLYDGTHFRAVATHGLRPDWAEAQYRPRPPTNAADDELRAGARLVHYPDLAALAEETGDARMRSAVASGVRTILRVPFRREGMLLGYISAYREEVKPFSEREIALLESFAAQAAIAIENARLINETREALDQQTATAEVLGVINASPGDLQPVFESILDKAHRLCRANIGWLLTFDGEFVHTLAMHGLDDLDPVVASTPFRPGPAMERLIEGESFFQIPDIGELKDAPGTPQIWRVSCEILGTGSYLIVPLRKDGAVRGFINAFRSPVRLFSEKEIGLLQNFAEQAVIAMENARLLGELHERTDDLQESLEYQTATSDVLKVISRSTFDLQPVLDTLVETAARLFGATFAFIATRDGARYRPTALYSVSPEWEVLLRTQSFAPDRGTVLGRALLETRIVQVADIVADAEHTNPEAVTLGRARTVVGAPLSREGEAIGVMVLARQHVEPFTERQIDLIRTFADQAVIAIENTRLITETREALEQQTATAEVLQVINSSPGDLAPVFDALLEKALRLCGGAFGVFQRYDGEFFHAAAMQGMPPALVEFMRQPFRVGRGASTRRLADGESIVHIADMAAEEQTPGLRAMVEMGGGRTVVFVALRREETLLGFIAIYRQEVRLFSDKQIGLLQNFAAQAVIAMENARLITETREALEQQTATAEVLGVINSSPGDLVPVFDAMLDKAMRLCEAAFGHLWTHDGGLFRAVALRGASARYAELLSGQPVRAPPGSMLGDLAQGSDAAQFLDVAAEEAYRTIPAGRALIELGGARTVIGVPLRKDDALLGAISIYRREVRPFSDKQIALLQNFAAQAVIAMENARLITETRQRTDELQEALAYQTATGEVLRIVASSPDRLAPVFEAILERATELCGVKAANLYLHDDGAFRAAAALHPDPKMVADMIENPIRPGPGTAIYRAFSTRTPVHIADIADDSAYGAGNPFRMRMVERGVRAVLLVPLVRGDEAIGVVTIYRPVPEPYTEAQIELVRTFADQAVIAIENARLFGELRAARDAAEAAYRDLQTAQSSLVQAQKMAALGQLTAGIAHEIKNPLNFINNFAGLSTELLEELKEELASLPDEKREAVDETIAMLTGNLDKIAEHGRRADNIVKSMLEHSRGVSGEKRAVDLNALIDEALNLAYHGARAQDQSFNITLERDYAAALAPIELAPQEMTRALLNLFGNGFYAAHKRAQQLAPAKAEGGAYRPTLYVVTRATDNAVEITIRDNGTGIPADIRDKLFQPFFTTKPTGEGTGLGLSISYDIVTQQHGGAIAVASEEGAYTEFTIRLPRG